MDRIALLIGVGHYGHGCSALQAPLNDIEALKNVLQDPELGEFDIVKTLPNPDPVEMEKEIYLLFNKRKNDDVTLLYFSGHGFDEMDGFYFGTRNTCKKDGTLLKTTTFPAKLLDAIMGFSPNKKQIVILDCCESGAFGNTFQPNYNNANLEQTLKKQGRVILTSCTSTKPSFEEKETGFSVYTRYLIEGIKTGEAADRNNQQEITVASLHRYVEEKIKDNFRDMHPEMYLSQSDNFLITIAKAPILNPKLKYRKEFERLYEDNKISEKSRIKLNNLRNKLQLSPEDATAIENQVSSEYQANLQRFEEYVRKVVQDDISK